MRVQEELSCVDPTRGDGAKEPCRVGPARANVCQRAVVDRSRYDQTRVQELVLDHVLQLTRGQPCVQEEPCHMDP